MKFKLDHISYAVSSTMNLISYCDGMLSLLEIAELVGEPFWELYAIAEKLKKHRLLIEENWAICS